MVRFTKNMETGIKEIDDQHKMLMDKINSVLDAKAQAQKSTKNQLYDMLIIFFDSAKDHFKYEEQLMEFSFYPDLEVHKATHDIFSVRFDEFLREYQRSPKSPNILLRINDSVGKDLADHIHHHDKPFAIYYNDKLTS